MVCILVSMRLETSRRNRVLVALSVLLTGLVVVVAIAGPLALIFLPADQRIDGEGRSIAASVIFVGSYLALASAEFPALASTGPASRWSAPGLMVASGALPLEDAYKAVDLDTITLLLGMMIVVASLRLSGFFAVANAWVGAHAGRPSILLGAVVAISGGFSAFMVNDAVCLVLTPLVLELTLALGRRADALSAGGGHGIECRVHRDDHRQSAEHHDRQLLPYPLRKIRPGVGPVALVGLVVTVALIALFHRDRVLRRRRDWTRRRAKIDANRVLVIRALLATLVLIASFFAGVVPAKAAIIVGGLLLLTRRVKSWRVYAEIDWSLLLMFAGLVHHRCRRAARAARPRHHCRRGPASSRPGSGAQRLDGGVVQPGQQRAGGVDAEAVCRCARQTTTRHG